MMEVVADFKIPEIRENWAEVMGDIGLLVYASIEQNFIEGGRLVKWPPLARTGEPSHLYKSGALLESLTMESGEDFARVYVDTNLIPYAAIHNFGGTIVFKTKGYSIQMPQRQYMMFQEEDKTAILKTLGGAVFITPTIRRAV